ncbi:MAG: glycosyltransferase family 2 protein [Gammaproteobacteria bacterium]|nr:glycosyltransferase family 2 protein [Gammaproteobacteria bacterium]MCY4270123.1 glycosyltransferase family 2 protein [Gammaproteobacteria bacterium]MCY4296268.1 glycosyltransferase family 2 protein [Gammaproteobacteria bacterium]
MEPARKTETCAIVVTHHPDITPLLTMLGQLNRETNFLVVDNDSPSIGQLEESITAYENCLGILRREQNEGLARALNIGIGRALKEGFDYIFLFDQDSNPCDSYVERMVEAYRQVRGHSSRGIAALGPRIINPQTSRKTPFKLFNRLWSRTDQRYAGSGAHFVADFLITSGTMLVARHLTEIGLMREDYFIDNVDLEWCFRARSMGFDLVGTNLAILYHLIGERSLNPLVRAGVMAQHKPARTYYSSRNRIHLYTRAYSPIGWKARDIVRFALKALWLLLSSPQRGQYWKHISAGVRDARQLR